MCQCFHQCWKDGDFVASILVIRRSNNAYFCLHMSQTTKAFWRQICNNNQNNCLITMKISAGKLPAQDTSCIIHHVVVILHMNEASSYYFLRTCPPNKNKMHLESGDCCMQSIISCRNDLARVSNKKPQTDSLTYDFFVPIIQTRRILLSRNTLAEKWCFFLKSSW